MLMEGFGQDMKDLKIYGDLVQGSDEWHSARLGLMTASELNLIITATGKIADNEKTRKHVYELAAQRITGYVEPSYIGDNMLRGWQDEITARELYSARRSPVIEIGGMVRDFGSFKLWCSPDGLVSEDGGIEVKSRVQKYQVECVVTGEVPQEHRLQVQAGLLVSGREWWDYISYSGGMVMQVIRVMPDMEMQTAIMKACEAFESKVQDVVNRYHAAVDKMGDDVIMTERTVEQEVYLG